MNKIDRAVVSNVDHHAVIVKGDCVVGQNDWTEQGVGRSTIADDHTIGITHDHRV